MQHDGARAVDEDDWFTTGDVATIDLLGHMEVTDRSKDVIKSGGEWISSIAIENVAMAHPKVWQCSPGSTCGLLSLVLKTVSWLSASINCLLRNFFCASQEAAGCCSGPSLAPDEQPGDGMQDAGEGWQGRVLSCAGG